jgi:imidazolonepropionase-like amidohydrolase
VQEARAFGKYVMAHCWTAGAMNNALDAGVRSLEHGSLIDEATAKRMAAQDAFLVPTVVILEVPESVKIAEGAGVSIGSGSDLLGPRQSRRASEIAEKARHLGTMAAIISATKTNAELFRMEERIGTVEEGKDADLILVNGDPVNDIACLVDAQNIALVLKGGDVVKDAS